jgi:hypothetical protein
MEYFIKITPIVSGNWNFIAFEENTTLFPVIVVKMNHAKPDKPVI